jgi:NADH dehydrogenase
MSVEKNHKSQIIVDKYLRIPFKECVFAAGDIAQLGDIGGKILPPTAQTAEQSGQQAAHNILHLIQGKAMRPSDLNMRGMMVALGGDYASVSLLGWIRASGIMGHVIKTIIMRSYRYILHTQCAKAIDSKPKSKSRCGF